MGPPVCSAGGYHRRHQSQMAQHRCSNWYRRIGQPAGGPNLHSFIPGGSTSVGRKWWLRLPQLCHWPRWWWFIGRGGGILQPMGKFKNSSQLGPPTLLQHRSTCRICAAQSEHPLSDKCVVLQELVLGDAAHTQFFTIVRCMRMLLNIRFQPRISHYQSYNTA